MHRIWLPLQVTVVAVGHDFKSVDAWVFVHCAVCYSASVLTRFHVFNDQLQEAAFGSRLVIDLSVILPQAHGLLDVVFALGFPWAVCLHGETAAHPLRLE